MNNLPFSAIVLIVLVICFDSASLSQTKPVGREKVKNWFVARVVDTEPFTIEYLDDWARRQPPRMRDNDYQNSIEVNPQSQLEKIDTFKIGDIIWGESCVLWFGCPASVLPYDVKRLESKAGDFQAGMSMPPTIAINLKLLSAGKAAKYLSRGFLISYSLKEKYTIELLNVFRDGTMMLEGAGGNRARRCLSPANLKVLNRLYKQLVTSKDRSEASDDYLKPRLWLNFDRHRYFGIDDSATGLKPLVSELDELVEKTVKNSTYSIHYWLRFRIKDWQFGGILPLDAAVSKDPSYLRKNWQRLSPTMAPKVFFEEAKQRHGGFNPNVYRFKGALYGFEFANCTDRPSGSWACFQAWPLKNEKSPDGTGWVYRDWPVQLGARLRNMPLNIKNEVPIWDTNGLDIRKADLERNREFYLSLLGDGGWFREGNYIYADVTVKFR